MIPSSPIVAVGELLWDMLPTGKRAGGAPFNFAFHCQQLGHPAIIVSRVGDDVLGAELRAEVRRLGMSDAYIQTDPTFPTGTVDVVLDATGQPTYTIQQPVAWDHLAWDDGLTALAASAVAVCYGTLAQREPVTRTTLQRFLQTVPASCVRVCDINLRPTATNPNIWRAAVTGCQWLKLNNDELEPVATALGVDLTPPMRPPLPLLRFGEGEPTNEQLHAQATTGSPLSASERGVRGVRSLAPHADLVCLTRGAHGALVYQRGQFIEVPGRVVRVADTVGAGDAFTAALLVRTLRGATPEAALTFANAYASLVASRVGGTPTISAAEIAGCV